MITPRHGSTRRALAATALVMAGLTAGVTGGPQPASGQTNNSVFRRR